MNARLWQSLSDHQLRALFNDFLCEQIAIAFQITEREVVNKFAALFNDNLTVSLSWEAVTYDDLNVYFEKNYTQEKIAAIYGVTKGQVQYKKEKLFPAWRKLHLKELELKYGVELKE